MKRPCFCLLVFRSNAKAMCRWFPFQFLYCLYHYDSSKNQCANKKKKRRASEMAWWVSGFDAKPYDLSLNPNGGPSDPTFSPTSFCLHVPNTTCWFEQVFSWTHGCLLVFHGLLAQWPRSQWDSHPRVFTAPGYSLHQWTAPQAFQIAFGIFVFS